MSFASNVVCRTVVLYTRLKPNGKFRMGLKGTERLECITLLLPDKFENATLGAKTEQKFFVHTTAFYQRHNCLISL